MPSSRTRAAVEFVQSKMPPGTLVRDKSGNRFVMGVKFRMSDFWLMRLDSPEKRTCAATILKASYKAVDAEEVAHA